MSRLAPLALAAILAGCAGDVGDVAATDSEASPLTSSITINGTGLTPLTLFVPGFPAFASTAATPLTLTSGTNYVLQVSYGGVIGVFSVTAGGTVSYDPALNNTVFTGSGTPTLGVVAHAIALDATGLTAQTLQIGGFPGFSSAAVQHYQMPAISALAVEIATSGFIGYFGVHADGTVAYTAGLDHTVFSGAGTTTIGIVPHAITIDATGLSTQQLMIPGLASFGSAAPTTLQLASAVTYVLETGTSGLVGYFNVVAAGTVGYDPSLEGTAFTGSGTARLTVVSHTMTIDATALPAQQLHIAGFPAFNSAVVQQVRLPRGINYPLVTANSALIGYFHVVAGGMFDYPTTYNPVFLGRNTAKLTVVLASVFAPPARLQLPYNGGEVLATTAPLNVYLVFYGRWDINQIHFFENLAQHIGDSSWYQTLTQYKNAAGAFVQSGTRLAGEVFDNYSQGPNIDDGVVTRDLQSVLGNAFNNLGLPRDGGGVYMMLMSPDVGFTSSAGPDGTYCGYHAASLIGAQKYAAIPTSYAVRYPGCNWDGFTGSALDGMASVFVHELAEMITDPDAGGNSGYYDRNAQPGFGAGQENGDLCAWNDGAVLFRSNGTANKPWNLKLGDLYYHVQEMLTMQYPDYTGYCTMGAAYSAADNSIAVQSAVYGDNCSDGFVDITPAIRTACNGLAACSVVVDPALLAAYRGPATCSAALAVQWACWDGPRLASFAGVAGGAPVNLTCP